jgi:CxxC motif-containing protein (DUF1111 family)
MKKFYIISFITLLVTVFNMCHKAALFPESDYDKRLSGGAATVFDASSKALSNAIEGLSVRDQFVHSVGDNTFDQTFMAPPPPIFTGLGPIYNNISCVNCHRNDREGIPTTGSSSSGLLMRISQAGTGQHAGPLAIKGFGTQIQDQAVIGAEPEASVNITYMDVQVVYPDGTIEVLR